jgi:hypothetical protein
VLRSRTIRSLEISARVNSAVHCPSSQPVQTVRNPGSAVEPNLTDTLTQRPHGGVVAVAVVSLLVGQHDANRTAQPRRSHR